MEHYVAQAQLSTVQNTDLQNDFDMLSNKVTDMSREISQLAFKQQEIEESVLHLRMEQQQADAEIAGLRATKQLMQDGHNSLHKKIEDEHSSVGRRIASLKQQADNLEGLVKRVESEAVNNTPQSDRAQQRDSERNRDKSKPSAAVERELRPRVEKLEELVEKMTKKRELDARTLTAMGHQLNQTASSGILNEIAEVKEALGEIDQRQRHANATAEKANRLDEQMRAFVKRHEADIVAANVRIDELASQRGEELVRSAAKRVDKDILDIRKRSDYSVQLLQALKDEVNAELAKQRETSRAAQTKTETKLRELSLKGQELSSRLEHAERAVQAPVDASSRVDKLGKQVEVKNKDLTRQLIGVMQRVAQLEVGKQAQLTEEMKELSARMERLAQSPDESHEEISSPELKSKGKGSSSIESKVDGCIADVSSLRQEMRSKLRQNEERINALGEQCRSTAQRVEVLAAHPGATAGGSQQQAPAYEPAEVTAQFVTDHSESVQRSLVQEAPIVTAATIGVRPKLGVEVAEARHSLTGQTTVTVLKVIVGGPCEEAGVEAGDIILQWNGIFVTSREEFGRCIETTPLPSTVDLIVARQHTDADGTSTQQHLCCKVLLTIPV
eukprot:NODE_544_length_2118_cov_6.152731_g502_i0.p1 GENE.NODE_544_length_2118_cov_6.152731_g502_i0~~NODE_544_length_2118_cov_6.152731_g502_i0.p1  ORF type:complete len:683 (+),score=197.41 NODE_544_length_2118_cov_6.152731_g502_i0:205-2049(+)